MCISETVALTSGMKMLSSSFGKAWIQRLPRQPQGLIPGKTSGEEGKKEALVQLLKTEPF